MSGDMANDDSERILEIEGIRWKIHVGFRDGRWMAWLRVHTLRPGRWHRWNLPAVSGLSVGLWDPIWACSRDCDHHTKEEAVECALMRVSRVAPDVSSHLQAMRQRYDVPDDERARARQLRRAARLGRGWQALRRQVLCEEPACRLCGGSAEHVDHIRPLWDGGTNERENLQALCTSCHTKKSRDEMASGRHGGASEYPPQAGLVTLQEVASRLGVRYHTARRWRSKGTLPASTAVPGFYGEWWEWSVIEEWATATGRLK